LANLTVAIIGRPNTGKSTLFNRLVGKQQSIVSPVEGVTRDRVYGQVEWTGNTFNVIDTGGYLPDSDQVIEKSVRRQAEFAIDEADLLILLVDGRGEVTSSDKTLADIILKSSKPFVLAVNKVDENSLEINAHNFYELGMGEPFDIAASSGRKVGDLLDEIVARLPIGKKTPFDDIDLINLAIVGMPNVGKSSLMNALLDEEKSIVTDIAGTTRDSVDSYLKYYGKTFRLIDTAGLRRKAKIGDSIEFYSSVRTYRVIDESDVAIVMIDASKGFGNQDQSIVRYVLDRGKGLVLIINKWDLIEKDTHSMRNFKQNIQDQFRDMEHYPNIFISVLTKQRLGKVMETAQMVYDNRLKEISTSNLNDFVERAMYQYPPPAVKGKVLKIKYATQVHSAPTVFAFFSNYPELFPVAYQRYLKNQLRKTFELDGVPIKISFRKK